MLANNINEECENKYNIGICSVRGGSLIGEHSVLFLGKNESIEITHTAYSRDIFIEGALQAINFILTKRDGIYGMQDLS